MIEQTVIFCGGLGTRLSPLTKKVPKPMVLVDGKPFLYYLILQSKANGIKNFLILCGYKHQLIKKYFSDGKKFGVKIKYHYNDPKIATLKRLIDAKHLLKKKFLLLYGDNYSSLNLHNLFNQKNYQKNKILITVCKKKHGNIELDNKKNIVKKYSFKKNIRSNYVEIGYMILNRNIIYKENNCKNLSFNYLVNDYVKKKRVIFYINDSDYLSISDIKRLNITRKFFKKKIILLDRDGVINYKNSNHYYVRSLDELKINKNFIKKYYQFLKKKKIICITNQAGIFTGDLTEKNLSLINKKIILEYKKNKLNIIDFFISKHDFLSSHIDRKPGHGLFLKASKKHKFILDRSIYIGDDLRDIEASYRAKVKCLYIGKKKLNFKLKNKYKFTLIKKLYN
jgi:histidinol-phosphate phosphatase family protein